MITKFDCTCGNTDPRKAKYYDGALGYEAIVCTVCGRYSDHTGEHPADDWSKTFIVRSEITIRLEMKEALQDMRDGYNKPEARMKYDRLYKELSQMCK